MTVVTEKVKVLKVLKLKSDNGGKNLLLLYHISFFMGSEKSFELFHWVCWAAEQIETMKAAAAPVEVQSVLWQERGHWSDTSRGHETAERPWERTGEERRRGQCDSCSRWRIQTSVRAELLCDCQTGRLAAETVDAELRLSGLQRGWAKNNFPFYSPICKRFNLAARLRQTSTDHKSTHVLGSIKSLYERKQSGENKTKTVKNVTSSDEAFSHSTVYFHYSGFRMRFFILFRYKIPSHQFCRTL